MEMKLEIYMIINLDMILKQEKNMQRYIKLSKWLQNHNINIIAAINGAIQSDRDLLRKEVKNYKEIYLNCP